MGEQCPHSNLIHRLHEEICTCVVCYQRYHDSTREPRFLGCGHSLCYHCSENLLVGDGFLRCPRCTKIVERMTKNVAIIDLLEIIGNEQDVDIEADRGIRGEAVIRGIWGCLALRRCLTLRMARPVLCLGAVVLICMITSMITRMIREYNTDSNPLEPFRKCSGPIDLYLFRSGNHSLLSSYPLSDDGMVKSCAKNRPRLIFSGILGNQTYGKLDIPMFYDLEINFTLYDISKKNEKFFEFGFGEITGSHLSIKTLGWYVYKDRNVNTLLINKVNSVDLPKTFQMPAQFAHEHKTIYRITLMPNEQKILLLHKTTTGWEFFDVISYVTAEDVIPFFIIHSRKTAKISMQLKSTTRLGFNARTKWPDLYIDSKNTTIANEMFQLQPVIYRYTNIFSSPLICSIRCYFPLSILFEDLQGHAVPLSMPLLELRLQLYTRGSEHGFGNEILKLTLKRCVESGWTWTYYHTYCLEYAQQNGHVDRVNVQAFDWNQIAFFVDTFKGKASVYLKYINLLTERNVTLEDNLRVRIHVTLLVNFRVQLKTEKKNIGMWHIAIYGIDYFCTLILSAFSYILYIVFVCPCLYVADFMSSLFYFALLAFA